VLQAAARRMKEQPVRWAGSDAARKLIQTGVDRSATRRQPAAGALQRLQGRRDQPHAHGAQVLAPDKITSMRVPGRRRHRDVGAIDREIGALHGWARRGVERAIAGIPLGRPETPDDVAGVVAFLGAGLRLHDGAGDQGRRAW